MVDKCVEISKLPSYLTVTLKKIPQNYSENSVKSSL